jgi:hypothetical protein
LTRPHQTAHSNDQTNRMKMAHESLRYKNNARPGSEQHPQAALNRNPIVDRSRRVIQSDLMRRYRVVTRMVGAWDRPSKAPRRNVTDIPFAFSHHLRFHRRHPQSDCGTRCNWIPACAGMTLCVLKRTDTMSSPQYSPQCHPRETRHNVIPAKAGIQRAVN